MADGYVSGVRRGGIQSEPAFRPSLEIAQRDQAERVRRAEAFAASPRSRFIEALRGIKQLPTWEAEAWRAHDAYNRGFADPDWPPSVGELAIALRALNDVPGSDAIKARAAIAELLLEAHRRRVA